MCSRYNIVELQRKAEAGQISRRTDGTLIYRFAPDKWADASTLQRMLTVIAGKLEHLHAEVKKATGGEAPSLRQRGIELQTRLMNYQTGLAKLKGAQHEHADR